jgi:hypothetical protein
MTLLHTFFSLKSLNEYASGDGTNVLVLAAASAKITRLLPKNFTAGLLS